MNKFIKAYLNGHKLYKTPLCTSCWKICYNYDSRTYFCILKKNAISSLNL